MWSRKYVSCEAYTYKYKHTFIAHLNFITAFLNIMIYGYGITNSDIRKMED